MPYSEMKNEMFIPTAEALFSIVSKQLITRKEKLFDKYHSLMLEESQVSGGHICIIHVLWLVS